MHRHSDASALSQRRDDETTSEQPEIPRSEYSRIRTLAAYGMTIKQVAEVYGVAAREIEQIVSRADGLGDLSPSVSRT